MNAVLILPFLIGILILFVVLKLLALPMKLILKLVINGLVGGVFILVVNWIGAGFGFSIVLNWITALFVGFLGVPGVIILALLQVFGVLAMFGM